MSKLILLGDSHTRSYTSSSSIDEIYFIGQGRKINFATFRSTLNFLVRYIAVSSKYLSTETSFVLIAGEPDARYISYGSFDILRPPEELITKNCSSFSINSESKKLIIKSMKMIKFFLFVVNLLGVKPSIIIGVGSPNHEMREISREFNNFLSVIAKSQDIIFFDPSFIYYNNPTCASRFIATTYNNSSVIDATHFSSEVGVAFDNYITDSFFSVESSKVSRPHLAIKILYPFLKSMFKFRYSDLFKVHRLYPRF